MIGVIAIAALAFVAMRPAYLSSDARPVITIGAILPLSGNNAVIGTSARSGIIMALEKINSNPDNRYRYRVVIEDGFDAARGIVVYEKLRNVDRIDVLLSGNAAMGHALRDRVRRDEILHISLSADYAVSDNESTFNHNSDLDSVSRQLAGYLKQRGFETISLVSFQHLAGEAVMRALTPELETAGIRIVGTERLSPAERQFRQEAARVVATNPDVVMMYTYEPILSLFARELRQQGFRGRITTLYLFAFTPDKTLFNDDFFVDIPSGTEEFAEKYAVRFGGRVADASAALSFDNVMIIHRLFEKYGRDTTNLRERLLGIIAEYDGINGRLSMNDKGTIFPGSIIRYIKDGEIK